MLRLSPGLSGHRATMVPARSSPKVYPSRNFYQRRKRDVEISFFTEKRCSGPDFRTALAGAPPAGSGLPESLQRLERYRFADRSTAAPLDRRLKRDQRGEAVGKLAKPGADDHKKKSRRMCEILRRAHKKKRHNRFLSYQSIIITSSEVMELRF